jgi:hypothetical protein
MEFGPRVTVHPVTTQAVCHLAEIIEEGSDSDSRSAIITPTDHVFFFHLSVRHTDLQGHLNSPHWPIYQWKVC